MHHLIRAIEKSIESENWYAALTLSLTLPDICAKHSETDPKGKVRYLNWFNKYMNLDYGHCLSGEDCYALRCVYLHEGVSSVNIQSARGNLDGFVFIASKTRAAHRNRVGSVVQLDLITFCEDICKAVERWIEDFDLQTLDDKILNILVLQDEDIISFDDGVKVIQSDGRERWGSVYESRIESLKDRDKSLGVNEENDGTMDLLGIELEKIFIIHGFAMLLPRDKDFYIGFDKFGFVIRGEHFGRVNADFQNKLLEFIDFDPEEVERIRRMSELQIGKSLRNSLEKLFRKFYLLELKAVSDTAIIGYDLRVQEPPGFFVTGWDLIFLDPEFR